MHEASSGMPVSARILQGTLLRRRNKNADLQL
jgi:hypothetical protein